MELWVLAYENNGSFIYLTPDNGHTTHVTYALKFASLVSAIAHKKDLTHFLEFTPMLHHFDF